MKPYDPEGRQGPSKNLPDAVNLVEYVFSILIAMIATDQTGPSQRPPSRSDPSTRTPLSSPSLLNRLSNSKSRKCAGRLVGYRIVPYAHGLVTILLHLLGCLVVALVCLTNSAQLAFLYSLDHPRGIPS